MPNLSFFASLPNNILKNSSDRVLWFIKILTAMFSLTSFSCGQFSFLKDSIPHLINFIFFFHFRAVIQNSLSSMEITKRNTGIGCELVVSAVEKTKVGQGVESVCICGREEGE